MQLSDYRRSPLALALAFAFALPVTSVAFAQDAAEDEEERSEDTKLDAITVTGSRIKRAEIEGPAPVTVITREELDREGHVTVYDALNTLTQAAGTVQNELFQAGFTPNASVLNLRGLGPGRTLVLINGRRAADYPLPYNGQSNFVNLASIPSAAVERIEVLAGGASAIYGSDAVAGVINIVLRTNFEGNQISYRWGYPTEGGSDTHDLQFVGGQTGDNWNITYAAQYFNRGEIFASEREFMDSYRDDPSVAPGEATPVSGLFIWDRLNPSGRGTYVGIDDSICSQFDAYETHTFIRGDACGYFGYPATQVIRNADENLSVYAFGSYDFDNGMQAYFGLNAWDSEAVVAGATQFWQALYFDPQFDTIVQLQRIFTPQETGGIKGQNRVFEERAIDFYAGVRGTMWDNRFDWDATISRSSYDTENDRPRLLRDNVNSFFLGEQTGTQFGFPVQEVDLDRYLRPLTEAEFDSLNTVVHTEADSSNTQLSFVVTGDLWEMPAGPIGFATVLEAGSQEYELTADPRILPGQNVIYNLTGTGGGGERDRFAVGLEFSIPLLDSLTASLAGRYDKYDDITNVDDAFTYNVGIEWRPIESLLIRGAYATSFRAPDMHFVFADESGFFSGIFDEFACRSAGFTVQECGNQAAYNYTAFGVRSGNPELEEEEGESYTAGFVWDAFDNFSVSVDYYNIELEGVVGDISSSYILQNEADCRLGVDRQGNPVDSGSAFCQFILSSVVRTVGGPNDGRVEQVTRGPINRAFLGTDGIDASLRYTVETQREGTFDFQLAWSHTLGQEFAEFPGEPIDEYRDDLTNFDWRSRVRGSVTWEYEKFRTTLFGTRYGSLPNWAETGRIAPYHVYNFTTRYQATDNFAVSLLVNNVLNKFAPKDDTFFTYPFFWRGYSPIGREVFVQFDYRFN